MDGSLYKASDAWDYSTPKRHLPPRDAERQRVHGIAHVAAPDAVDERLDVALREHALHVEEESQVDLRHTEGGG